MMFGNRKALLSGIVLAMSLGFTGTAGAGSDADCAMCHDSVPVPDAHPPVEKVTVKACTMCHETAGGDPFFRVVHKQHADALGCETCHGDASAERAARLKKMMAE